MPTGETSPSRTCVIIFLNPWSGEVPNAESGTELVTGVCCIESERNVHGC
jgi:hypothetical protein